MPGYLRDRGCRRSHSGGRWRDRSRSRGRKRQQGRSRSRSCHRGRRRGRSRSGSRSSTPANLQKMRARGLQNWRTGFSVITYGGWINSVLVNFSLIGDVVDLLIKNLMLDPHNYYYDRYYCNFTQHTCPRTSHHCI